MKTKIIRSHKERGQSLTELAISFTFIMLLLAGIADMGRAFFTFISLRDAAQEGALYGSTAPDEINEIINRVCNGSNFMQNHACGSSSDASNAIQISINFVGAPCTGSGIEVVVSYQEFPIVMPFAGIFMGTQSIPINARVTDTILRPPCGT
jgi:hypothetical protein